LFNPEVLTAVVKPFIEEVLTTLPVKSTIEIDAFNDLLALMLITSEYPMHCHLNMYLHQQLNES